MTYYIAEIDEKQQITAVWVKEKTARGASVYDPNKHVFDSDSASGFFGASRRDIGNWLAKTSQRGLRHPDN